MWGWPDREAPGVAAISRRPGSRKEGRATLAEAEIRREPCSAQWAPTRPGGPKSDFAPTWPPACSRSPCKYLPLFIFLVCCAPLKSLPTTHRSVCSRPWLHLGPETVGPSSKGHGHCSPPCNPQGIPPQDNTVPSSPPRDTGELTGPGRG